MAKGLDGKFLHYGIRKEDLELISHGDMALKSGLKLAACIASACTVRIIGDAIAMIK